MSSSSGSTDQEKCPSDLNLGLIGNCNFSALVGEAGDVCWTCVPRVDGDPIFCTLLRSKKDLGFFDIQLEGFERAEQSYVRNTPVLQTRLISSSAEIMITDFFPRFMHFGRDFRPLNLIRRISVIKGHPRIRVRCHPTFGYGWGTPETTRGTNHLRYLLPTMTLRLTTDIPVAYIEDEIWFLLDEEVSLILHPDESLTEGPSVLAESFERQTTAFWKTWSRGLSIPLDRQEAVIRAAITLKLCSFEETGALVSSLTTSIPSGPHDRATDSRFCWIRDAFFVVDGLNQLGATDALQQYLKYLRNLIADFSVRKPDFLEPVHGVAHEKGMVQRDVHRLPGFRGSGGVVVGNNDFESQQNDVYGSVVLAAAHSFIDQRLETMGDQSLYDALKVVGDAAVKRFNVPDCGLWGERVCKTSCTTYSAVLCWAAADRLGKIGTLLGDEESAKYWCDQACTMYEEIMKEGYNESKGFFVSDLGGDSVDASLLLLNRLGLVDSADERFVRTVKEVEKELRQGSFCKRFSGDTSCYLACSCWLVDAKFSIGEVDEARAMFDEVLEVRSHVGLLSDTVDPSTKTLWGNYPQATAMVGLVRTAILLSNPWSSALSGGCSSRK